MSGHGNDDIDAAVLAIQKQELPQQRVVSAWGAATSALNNNTSHQQLNAPLLGGQQQQQMSGFQPQQMGKYMPPSSGIITPVYPNNPVVTTTPAPVYSSVSSTTTNVLPSSNYQVSATPMNMSLTSMDHYVFPNWVSLTFEDKQRQIEQNRVSYQMLLNNVKKEDVNARIEADLNNIRSHLEDAQNIVVRSNQIVNIKNGFAIPSYASNIETVKLLISSSIRHNTVLAGVIPQDSKRMNLFGSVNNYGQGLHVEPLQDKDGGFKQIGNLENTFICQISLSHIKSDLHAPIGVTFGEFETGASRIFRPYKESMGYVNVSTGKRYHYIIPANADISETMNVYVNSKEADHPFGYYYSWLTPSWKEILDRDRQGNLQDKYLYHLDHPISRYLYFHAIEDGIAPPAVDDKTGCALVPCDLAEYTAKRIAALVMSKIPTRNLEKFDIHFEVIGDAVVKTRMDNDIGLRVLDGIKNMSESVNGLADALREKLSVKSVHNQYSSRVSDNLSFPFHFELSMVYLFRDKAEDVYKREKDKMSNSPGY